MKLVSHRGNLNGKNPQLENTPEQILIALMGGFDVEIDLWVNDGNLLLGHDYGLYPIEESFLYKKNLLIHCKNLSALLFCQELSWPNYFFQNEDLYAVSSDGWIISHSDAAFKKGTLLMLPEKYALKPSELKELKLFGVCSDIIESYV
jgi:hypothetical protein